MILPLVSFLRSTDNKKNDLFFNSLILSWLFPTFFGSVQLRAIAWGKEKLISPWCYSKYKRVNLYIYFHVLTTFFLSTSFPYFTYNYSSSAANRSFPVLLLSKECSFNTKSYFSTIERLLSENSLLQGLTYKSLDIGSTSFNVSLCKILFSDLYLSIFEHNYEK